MNEKDEIYTQQILPMLEKIKEICDGASIPFLSAFCLDERKNGDGETEVLIAGGANLRSNTDKSPTSMLMAAGLIGIQGYESFSDVFDK